MGDSTRACDSPSPKSLTCLTWLTPGNALLPGITSKPVQITAAMQLLRSGVDIAVIALILGHFSGEGNLSRGVAGTNCCPGLV